MVLARFLFRVISCNPEFRFEYHFDVLRELPLFSGLAIYIGIAEVHIMGTANKTAIPRYVWPSVK